MELILTNPYVLYPYTIVLGLVVGSFLNVVVYRLPIILQRQWLDECTKILATTDPTPEKEPLNLAYPPSHCPQCKHAIRPWENIPVLSYMFLRGKCSACATPISLRYPFTELFCALLSLVVVVRFGPTVQAAAALFLTWGLLAMGLIDYDTQLLPDNLTLPLLWVGLLLSLIGVFTDAESAILGAACGYICLWSTFQIFWLITGKAGMGYGDFKLLAVFGAWLGWHNLPQIILLSSCTGALLGVSLILLKKLKRNQPMPFGPYLAVAGWVSLLWGEPLNQLYWEWWLFI